MNEDHFNLQLRRFLKKVGITSQREIETAVRAALEDGRLKGSERLGASVRLTVPELGIDVAVEDVIALDEG